MTHLYFWILLRVINQKNHFFLSHRSSGIIPIITRVFAEENNIKLLFSPPYAPNLNLVERLWEFTKKHLVNNTYYEDFAQFVNATESFFYNLDDYRQELFSLFTQKFQIMHAE